MEIDWAAMNRVFLAEAEETLDVLEEGLLALETASDEEDVLGSIFRAAHTLKGSAGSLGFEEVAEVAHALEDVLERLRDGGLRISGDLITLLLQSTDVLRDLAIRAVEGGEARAEARSAVLARLRSAMRPEADADLGTGGGGGTSGEQGGAASVPTRERSLRVDLAKLDRLVDLTGEIVVARGQVERIAAELEGDCGRRLLEAHHAADQLYRDLQELVLSMRMVPMGPLLRQYARVVRDAATATGKRARLTIAGEEVEVDTAIVEKLRDPLTHLIRNAVSHGIEPPEDRLAAGKDAVGVVAVRAYRDAGGLVIEVADDGSGLDVDRLSARSQDAGVVDATDSLTEAGIRELIFVPGLSTAETVTDLAGRGVGLDIVRRNVEALRGGVGVESRPGEGTTFTLRLPLTLAMIDGFGVGVDGERFVLPLDAVVECVELPPGARRRAARGVIDLRGRALPYVDLGEALGLDDTRTPVRETVVVVRHGEERVGFVVDAVYGAEQTVVKPLDSWFRACPGLSGFTILSDGRVALILDIAGLLRWDARGSTEPESWRGSAIPDRTSRTGDREGRRPRRIGGRDAGRQGARLAASGPAATNGRA